MSAPVRPPKSTDWPVDTALRSRGAMRPSFGEISARRGRGECRMPVAPAASRVKSGDTRVSPPQVHRDHPAFPHAMVLTVSFALSPVIGLSCHRHQRNCFHQLDASVEASGPHDFAVRVSAVRYRHLRVHRIPPRVRDDREPPLMWDRTAGNKPVIWVWCEGEIFFRMGLDRGIT
jgi:hypothetical protein